MPQKNVISRLLFRISMRLLNNMTPLKTRMLWRHSNTCLCPKLCWERKLYFYIFSWNCFVPQIKIEIYKFVQKCSSFFDLKWISWHFPTRWCGRLEISKLFWVFLSWRLPFTRFCIFLTCYTGLQRGTPFISSHIKNTDIYRTILQ